MSVNILLAYTHRHRLSLAAVKTRIRYTTSPKDRRIGLTTRVQLYEYCTSLSKYDWRRLNTAAHQFSDADRDRYAVHSATDSTFYGPFIHLLAWRAK